jgi:TRAP-type C4-dicarboxylate transport system permease small subunit
MGIAVDLLILVSCFFCIYLKFKIWTLTQDRGMLLLGIALLYIALVRILITMDLPVLRGYSSELVLPFWILFPIGLSLLYKSLKKYIHK